VESKLFYDGDYAQIADRIKEFLNGHQDFLSGSTIKSTRATGDAIEDILSENFESLLTEQWCKDYSSQFARRAMADLAFNDHDGLYYVVDVKTHRLSTWMIELCDTLLEFYPKEIAKIGKRISRFERIRAEWEARPHT